jgi:hypothetical protein
MARKTRLLCLALAGGLMAAAPQAWPASSSAGGPPGLAAWARQDFTVARRAELAALSQVGRDAAGPHFLNLAELHLAKGLLHEARAYHEAAARAGAADTPRGQRLALVVALFEDPAQVPPDDPRLEAPDWPAAPYYRALARLDAGPALDEPLLDAARAAVRHVPDALLERSLPQLLEATLAADFWAASHEFAQIMSEHPVLKDAPAFHFLLGRAAERNESDLAAFDSYERAALGRDRWAHRARLALIALAERRELLPPEARLEMMRAARWHWGGDDLAAESLLDLAALETEQGNLVEAVLVLHDLRQRHPQTSYAQMALTLGESLMAEFYEAGDAGRISLPDYVEGHARIAADHRLSPGFALLAEGFADSMLAHGFTALAAREFRDTAEYLVVAETLGLARDTAGDQDRLRLRAAEALLAGKQYADAAALLEADLRAPDAAHLAQRARLRRQLLAETGQADALLAAEPAEPDPQFLTSKAEALFAAQRWEAALKAFEALWAMQGADLPPDLAAHMVLSAHRAGAVERLRDIVAALPQLTEAPEWTLVAETLAAERPEIFPLRRSVIKQVLDEVVPLKNSKDNNQDP